jgi:cyclohexadienyl dehydratase
LPWLLLYSKIQQKNLGGFQMKLLKNYFYVIFPLMLALVFTCTPMALAGKRLDKIMDTKIIKIGTPGDYRPFAILENGDYSGFDIDLIKAIAEELGVTVEFVPTTWSKMLDDLKANKFDIAVGGITRTVTRMLKADFLPGYAPFGKVALIRAKDKKKFTSLESLNQPNVKVIKNPGGTNEKFVLENLTKANVSTHEKNAEIPALIADGTGDVMITETYEALNYAKKDSRLFAAFIDKPLTKVNTLGFMIQKDDPDFARLVNFAWNLLELRGQIKNIENKWLK